MDDIQKQSEKFLSKASAIIFRADGNDIVMNFFFDRSVFDYYKKKKNHETLHNYLADKKIKLVIIESPTEYKISLIDITTADSLNLSDVKFEHQSLLWFLNSVPTDKTFNMILSGVSDDGTTLVYSPIRKVVEIHGYSYSPLK